MQTPDPPPSSGRDAWWARANPKPQAPQPIRPPRVQVPLVLQIPGTLENPATRARLEVQLQRYAMPVALAIAWWIHGGPLGQALQRITLGMMVHESGHAVTAWLCGFIAVPGPWVTRVAEHRSVPWMLVVAGLLVAGVVALRRADRPRLAVAVSTLLVAQAWGSLVLSERTAQMLFTFGGDGMGMVLAALLVGSFALGADNPVTGKGLRWGYLVIGAGASVDLAAPWWRARHDPDAIPYGKIEGVGLSDPSKLAHDYGWAQRELIGRYLAVSCACMLLMAAAWWWGQRRAARAPVEPLGINGEGL